MSLLEGENETALLGFIANGLLSELAQWSVEMFGPRQWGGLEWQLHGDRPDVPGLIQGRKILHAATQTVGGTNTDGWQ